MCNLPKGSCFGEKVPKAQPNALASPKTEAHKTKQLEEKLKRLQNEPEAFKSKANLWEARHGCKLVRNLLLPHHCRCSNASLSKAQPDCCS